MKKLLCLFLTFVMLLVTSASTFAYAVDEPYVVSVITYDEIKDPELLLQTAVARSKARGVNNITLYGDETDDKAVVKQVLKETTYSDGHIEQDSVLTGISSFEDVNGDLVARNPIFIDNFEKGGSLGESYATLKINVHSQIRGETIFGAIVARITALSVSCSNAPSSAFATRVSFLYKVDYECATQIEERQDLPVSGNEWVTMYTKDPGYYELHGVLGQSVIGSATIHLSNGNSFRIDMNVDEYLDDL